MGGKQYGGTNPKPETSRTTPTSRIPGCKYREKCNSISNITKRHKCTIADLNHLCEYSHPRKICGDGMRCLHYTRLMNGSYDLEDLCHYSVYLHPSSRFITQFNSCKNPTNKNDDNNNNNNNNNSGSIKNSALDSNNNNRTNSPNNTLQVQKTGGKDGIESSKKVGIMICDGRCGSVITRGLWKCWCYRDLIWKYQYRRYVNNRDLTKSQHENKPKIGNVNDEDRESRNFDLALSTMIESIIAVAGEVFLEQMDIIMNECSNDTQETKSTESQSQGRLSQKSINEKHLKENGTERNKRWRKEFGELLLEFSESARQEFGYPDQDFFSRKTKKWQNSAVCGVLIGIANGKLRVPPLDSITRKPLLKSTRNLRSEIFTKGCENGTRTLFQEVEANNFEIALQIGEFSEKTKQHLDEVHNTSDSGNQSSYSYINYNWETLQEVAMEKLNHPRHLAMGACLQESELMSILLLTGTSVGVDLINSHRTKKNYCKWRVLQNNLMSALRKMYEYDKNHLPNQLFHGLKRDTNMEKDENTEEEQMFLFNTFVSTTLDHRLIQSSFTTRKEGALLFLDRQTPVICADISWISKFTFEHEILFAPCALTLPSPFNDTEKTVDKKSRNNPSNKPSNHSRRPHNHKHKHKSHKKKDAESGRKDKQKRKDKSGKNSGRERGISLADLSASRRGYTDNQKKSKSDKEKKKKKEGAQISRDLRGALKFSLIDGRLEAFSIDSTYSQNIGTSILATHTSPIVVEDQEKNSKENQTNTTHSTDVLNDLANRIDLNVVTDFLYGNTTPQLLWEHLDVKKEGFISMDRLQNLFLAVFVLSIQIEAASANMYAYLGRCQQLAIDCAQQFANSVSSDIGSNQLTQKNFLENSMMLNDMHNSFSATLLQQIIHETGNTPLKKTDDVATPISPSPQNQTQTVAIENISNYVAAIRNYCTNMCTLSELWIAFTQSTLEKPAEFADYTQFDMLVFAALAFFVQQRNPDAPLASRQSLNPLIDQLSMSLLALYDPKKRGYITYSDFEAFGEYLRDEYSKLRSSILASSDVQQQMEAEEYDNINISAEPFPIDAENPTQKMPMQEKKEQEEDSSDDSILGAPPDHVPNPEIKKNSGELEVTDKNRDEEESEGKREHLRSDSEIDRDIAISLEEMKTQVEILLENIKREKNVNVNIEEILEQITAGIKEMEIQCNNLKDSNLRYKYAQMINTLDTHKYTIHAKLFPNS